MFLTRRLLPLLCAAFALGLGASGCATARVDLSGYAEPGGAITTLRNGEAVDPYFALQALLLAHDNGLDVSPYAQKWAEWLAGRQKLDGTFDRFCKEGPVWLGCQSADADDALLALWMKFLTTLPDQLRSQQVLAKSYQASKVSLERLRDTRRGIYLVSPVYQHGLLMDNLEIWSSTGPAQKGGRADPQFTRAIRDVFWDPQSKRFLVSTQPEQKHEAAAFYPDHVAQIFPLLVGYPLLPDDPHAYYRDWMGKYRGAWLSQGKHDYPWGLLGVLALRHNDELSARCWLRETAGLRHTDRWSVTDEVALQILSRSGLAPAESDVACV